MLFLLLLVIVLIILYENYNSRTHIKCDPEQLCEDADVISVDAKPVGLKRTMCYRTTVVFSDGFKYISHTTNRVDGVFQYKIWITPQMKNDIVTEAKAAHLQRLREYQRENGIPIVDIAKKTNDDEVDYKVPPQTIVKSIPAIRAKPDAKSDGTTWECTVCKRKNLSSSNKCWNCANAKEEKEE